MSEETTKTIDPFERIRRDVKKHGLIFQIEGIYDYKEGPINVGSDLCAGEAGLQVGDVSLIAKNNGKDIKFTTCCLKDKICVGEDIIVGSDNTCTEDIYRVNDYDFDPTVKELVVFDNSTKNINQSIRLFEGNSTPIQTAVVELLDENGFLSRVFKPGFQVDDIIGRCANLSFNVDCKDHPEVSKSIVKGAIVELEWRPCSVVLTIQAASSLLDREIFSDPFKGELASDLDLISKDFSVNNITGDELLTSVDDFSSYLLIGSDERAEVSGPVTEPTPGNLVVGSRGSFGDGIFTQQSETEVKAIYKVESNVIDVVLKLMVSGSETGGVYDVYPVGAGISPDFIDVQRFLDIQQTFFISHPDICVWFKDGENLRDLLEKEILGPFGMTLTTKGDGTISVVKLAPAIFREEQLELNACNITNPLRLRWTRSNKRYYYSSVSFFYDFDIVNCSPREASIKVSTESLNRFSKSGFRNLDLVSRGTKREDDSVILSESCKYLDRFQFGAKYFRGVETFLDIGICLDVGDVVRLNTSGLEISSDVRGDREGEEILLEVVSKRIDLKKNKATLDLLSTGFDTQARFGLIAPSSKIDQASSTITKLSLLPSFGSADISEEIDKWCDFVGETMSILDECGELVHEGIISAVDATGVTFTPALVAPLTECHFLEPGAFVCDGIESKWEKTFVHIQEALDVIGVTSDNRPVLNLEDVGCAFPLPEPSNSPCFDIDPTTPKRPAFIQSEDSCRTSSEFFICNIQGGAIVPDRDIDIQIEPGDKIMIGGIDSNQAYRMF